jgi:outer membrane protein assembly factor BamB
MYNKMNASVVWKGYLYGVGERGELRCLNLADGNLVWGQKGFGEGSVMLADGKLIVMGEKGNLVVAEATSEGYKPLAQANVLSGRCWTVPVLANGRIYVRNATGRLLCLNVNGAKTACTTDSGGFEWTDFRGPNRNGKSSETGLLKKWPAGGPELVWETEGLGGGFASVVIANGYVYTTGMVGPDKKGMVFAFDVDGNPKWSESYGQGWKGSHRGTRTTPTIDGDRLYVMSGYGNLVCFDAKSGAKNWEVDTLKEFSGENIRWGISESVLIYGDKVICTPGGKDATVVALNKMNGETIWTTKGLSEKSAYCSPVVIERGGKKMILTMVQKSIVLIDPDSGNVILRIPHEGKHEISAVSPLYKDGVIYATTGYGYGGKAYELSADTSSYTEKWSDKNLDCHHGGVILLGNDIIGSNDDGDKANKNKKSWICLDMVSGKMKYWDKLIGKGSLIYAEGLLYCYGESGKVGLMKATPSGFELISSFEITKGEEEHWAHPVVCNGRLYIRHGDVLMVYNVKAGG